MHIRALLAAVLVPLLGLFVAPGRTAADLARPFIEAVRLFALPDLVLAGPDEVALQAARRETGWSIVDLGRRFRAWLERAKSHRRWHAGMFAIGDSGGPQQLAI